MNDPYRDQVFHCPACTTAALREYEGRLLCDACQGIYVTRADLVKAIEDISGLEAGLVVAADKPGEGACPRCEQKMMACRLRVSFAVIDKQPRTKPKLDRCDTDGIWFDADELAKVFEVVSRTAAPAGAGTG